MKTGVAPYVPKEVLARVIAAQDGCNVRRDQAILYFSHYLGLRAKEIALLSLGDVVTSDGSIKEVIRLFKTKGNKFRESFLVNTDARESLRRYLATRGIRHLDAPLFLSQKGGAFTPNTMQRLIANLYKKADIKASSHSGRRSFATNLIERGADIYSVMQMMGHSSITTTQGYFATSPERLKRFANIL